MESKPRTRAQKRQREAYLASLQELNRVYTEATQALKERANFTPEEHPGLYSDAGQLDAVLRERQTREVEEAKEGRAG